MSTQDPDQNSLNVISILVKECEESANHLVKLHHEDADYWRMQYLQLTELLIAATVEKDIPLDFVVEDAKLHSSLAATQLRENPSNLW